MGWLSKLFGSAEPRAIAWRKSENGNLTSVVQGVRRQRLWHRSGVADNGGIGSRRSDVRCPSSKHLAQVWRGVNGERASSGVGF